MNETVAQGVWSKICTSSLSRNGNKCFDM